MTSRRWWIVDESTDTADKADRWKYGRFIEYLFNHTPKDFQIEVCPVSELEAAQAEVERQSDMVTQLKIAVDKATNLIAQEREMVNKLTEQLSESGRLLEKETVINKILSEALEKYKNVCTSSGPNGSDWAAREALAKAEEMRK
jgi:multidrug resistance efflux pump